MLLRQLAAALLLALAGASAERAAAPAPALAASLQAGAPVLAGWPRSPSCSCGAAPDGRVASVGPRELCCPAPFDAPAVPLAFATRFTLRTRFRHAAVPAAVRGNTGAARGRAVSATPMDRKVLPLVPALPQVQAWFDSESGYYTIKDSPANATCEVRRCVTLPDPYP
jgi:hypothetical protein